MKPKGPKPERMIWLLSQRDAQTDECILWPYAVTDWGYGKVWSNGKCTRAHRVMCAEVYGPPTLERPDVAHSCGVKLCVNPRHLRYASRLENETDKDEHGTKPRGERNGRAKLTETDVRSIRAASASGASRKDLRGQYGLGETSLRKLLTRQTWPLVQ